MSGYTITFGALSPTIKEQMKAEGLEQASEELSIDLLDKISKGITLAAIHDILTSSELHKARGRIAKHLCLREKK